MRHFNSTLLILLLVSSFSYGGSAQDGRKNYQRFCAQCHGDNGVNTLPTAANFQRREGLRQSNRSLFSHIKSGKAGCPSFDSMLNDEQILDVITHLRKFGR